MSQFMEAFENAMTAMITKIVNDAVDAKLAQRSLLTPNDEQLKEAADKAVEVAMGEIDIEHEVRETLLRMDLSSELEGKLQREAELVIENAVDNASFTMRVSF